MSAHSDRVTVAEVNDFLSESLSFPRVGLSASLAERLAYHERKAELLARIAAEIDTAQAHETAANARRQLIELQTEAAWAAREAGEA